MSEFRKVSPHIDKFLTSVGSVERYQTTDYRVVEFTWENGQYRLVSTGDLYELNYCGVPILINPKLVKYRGRSYIIALIPKKSGGYYISTRKRVQMKDFVWACFGPRDIPKGYEVVCADGNPNNCKIENLEVKKHGIS